MALSASAGFWSAPTLEKNPRPSVMMAGDNHGGLFQEHRIVGIHIPGGYGADITISDVGDDVILDKVKIGRIERIAPLFQPAGLIAPNGESIGDVLHTEDEGHSLHSLDLARVNQGHDLFVIGRLGDRGPAEHYPLRPGEEYSLSGTSSQLD